MPGKDGTGPTGTGPVGGGGLGRQARSGRGRGRMKGPVSAGPEGFCECPKCGAKAPHQLGLPCSDVKCPQCGSIMVRK